MNAEKISQIVKQTEEKYFNEVKMLMDNNCPNLIITLEDFIRDYNLLINHYKLVKLRPIFNARDELFIKRPDLLIILFERGLIDKFSVDSIFKKIYKTISEEEKEKERYVNVQQEFEKKRQDLIKVAETELNDLAYELLRPDNHDEDDTLEDFYNNFYNIVFKYKIDNSDNAISKFKSVIKTRPELIVKMVDKELISREVGESWLISYWKGAPLDKKDKYRKQLEILGSNHFEREGIIKRYESIFEEIDKMRKRGLYDIDKLEDIQEELIKLQEDLRLYHDDFSPSEIEKYSNKIKNEVESIDDLKDIVDDDYGSR